MLILKQSTSIKIRMGPFMDATDAVAPEVGLTLAGADQAEVLKANGVATVTMGGAFVAITGCDGWYDYTAATTDVDVVGEVVFVVQDASVALPVYVRGYVVEEAVYDALYGAAAEGPLQGTTAGNKLDVAATGEAGLDLDNTTGTLTVAEIPTLDADISTRATPAQVATEMADALDTDTIAELGAVPSATPSLKAAIMFIYMKVRNKETTTTTALTIAKDDGTPIATSTVSEAGGTTTKGEYA